MQDGIVRGFWGIGLGLALVGLVGCETAPTAFEAREVAKVQAQIEAAKTPQDPRPTPPPAARVTPTLATTSSPAAGMTRAEVNEATALLLNLNGHLCAQVVQVQPLAVRPEHYEVTCITYRGGRAQQTYLLNMQTGLAWRP